MLYFGSVFIISTKCNHGRDQKIILQISFPINIGYSNGDYLYLYIWILTIPRTVHKPRKTVRYRNHRICKKMFIVYLCCTRRYLYPLLYQRVLQGKHSRRHYKNNNLSKHKTMVVPSSFLKYALVSLRQIRIIKPLKQE